MEFSLDKVFDSISADSFLEGVLSTDELSFHQKFVLKDIGISTRVMNHWDAKEIIPASSRNKGNKYIFNFTELIWLNIVKELREFGYPLENIKGAYRFLMTPLDFSEYYSTLSKAEREKIKKKAENIQLDNDDEKKKLIAKVKKILDDPTTIVGKYQTNILSVLINEFLVYRKEIKILVDQKGNVIPYFEDFIKHDGYYNFIEVSGFDSESFINISLFKFFRKFIMNKKHFRFLQDSNILNENEAHILSLIREGKAKTITIKFQDQKPYMLETTKEKKIEAETRLSEILLGRAYQDISIRTENGNISYSNITTKKILKKI